MKPDTSILFAVTGATGFLGSHMVQYLKNKGYWVRAVLRKHNAVTRPYYSQANEIKRADLSSPALTIGALQNIDYVFHFAADMGGVGYFSKEQYIPFITNMQMDLNVLSACEKNQVKRLFYPSSACAYPIDAAMKLKKVPKLREDMFIPANPDQMYGWEKLIMILLSNHTPFETRIGVLHTIFGAGQEWTGQRAKFPPAITYKVIEAARSHKKVHIWGNGKQLRTFLYVTDALEKIYEVMMSPKYFGPVNISNDEQVTVNQCVDWLCEFAGINPKYVYEKNKPTGVILRGVDNSKFNKHYKYRNKITTKEGFKLIFEYLSGINTR